MADDVQDAVNDAFDDSGSSDDGPSESTQEAVNDAFDDRESSDSGSETGSRPGSDPTDALPGGVRDVVDDVPDSSTGESGGGSSSTSGDSSGADDSSESTQDQVNDAFDDRESSDSGSETGSRPGSDPTDALPGGVRDVVDDVPDSSTRDSQSVQDRATEAVRETTPGDGVRGDSSPDVRFNPGSRAGQDAVNAAVAADTDDIETQGVESETGSTAQQARDFEDRLVNEGVEVQTEDGTRRIQIQDAREVAIQERNGELVPVFTDAFRTRRRRELAEEEAEGVAASDPAIDEEDVEVSVGDEGLEVSVEESAAEQARLRAARRQFEAERQGSRRPSDGGLTEGDDAQQVTTDRLQRFDAQDFEFDITEDEVSVGLTDAAARSDLRSQVAAQTDGVDEGDVVIENTDDGLSARVSDEAIQEQFASGMAGVDAEDVVLNRDGDQVSIDREATAERTLGADEQSDPGPTAEAAGFIAEGVRNARPVRSTALVTAAESLRTEDGLELQGPLEGVTLPGGGDVDDAQEVFEPAAQDFDAAADSAGAAVSSTIDDSPTAIRNAAAAAPGVPPGLGATGGLLASSEFGEEALGRGTAGGLRALNPARGAQDALTAGEYTVRGTEAATDANAAETLQTAGEATATAGSLAVTEGVPAATQAARDDPAGAAAVSVGGGVVIGSGAVLGGAGLRAGRATTRAALNPTETLSTGVRQAGRVRRRARSLVDDELQAFRQDTRGMAGGKMVERTRTETRETTPDQSEAQQMAQELEVEQFDDADAMAREQALILEREQMPPQEAFQSSDAYQEALRQRAARRLGTDVEEFQTSQQAQARITQTRQRQIEAEAAATGPFAGTLAATAFGTRPGTQERTRTREAYATPGLQREASAYGNPMAEMLGSLEGTLTAQRMGQPTDTITTQPTDTLESDALKTEELTVTDTMYDFDTTTDTTITGRGGGSSTRGRPPELPEEELEGANSPFSTLTTTGTFQSGIGDLDDILGR